MSRFSTTIKTFLAIGLFVLATVSPAHRVLAGACESPDVLRFSEIPAQDARRAADYYEPILVLLGRNTGKKVEMIVPRSYSSTIEGLTGKWIDFGVLGPESYVIAHGKDKGIEVFATYFRQADGIQPAGASYRSILITKKGSIYTTIESLKWASLALVDPASTSGSLIPEAIFPKDQQLPPLKQYFSRVIFSGRHDLSTLAVAEGKVDAAFVATSRFMEAIHTGTVKLDDFNVLWTSPPLPLDPFVFRSALCEELKKQISETFLTADQNQDGRRYLDNFHSERFVPMTDADYDVIRAVIK